VPRVAAEKKNQLLIFLEMIKFEHSVFALPFAMVGMMWGSFSRSGVLWPGWAIFGWIVLAMITCRSAAMAYNRIADRDIDALNPRTATRALPAGLLSLRKANLYFAGSIGLFLFSAFMLGPLALSLSPIALLLTLGYSHTKRFTWLCHFVLGMSLGVAPAAAYVAVAGRVDPVCFVIFGAVAAWTAGFDLIYALQDDDFDRDHGLHSFPARFGRGRALLTSRVMHSLAVILLGAFVVLTGGGLIAWAGVIFAAGLLAYEQSLVKPNDLSRVNMAFFTLNGYISAGFFVAQLADYLWGRRG
jgi:4-hydroxybenzoate polyprenyltransferase